GPASEYGGHLAPPLSRRGAGSLSDLQRGGGPRWPEEAPAGGGRTAPSAPGDLAGVCQLCGAPAVAAPSVWPGGTLYHPPRHGALPAPSQAEAPPPHPGKKNV